MTRLHRRILGPLALGVALTGVPAAAFPTGQWVQCTSCHGGGSTPTVGITLSDPTPEVGQGVQVTVSVSTPNGDQAGFWLEVGSGLLANRAGEGTQVQGGTEASHTEPKLAGANDTVTFTLDWTPSAPGTVNLTAWGNSVNGDGTPNGDRAASHSQGVQVGCPGGAAPTTWFRDRDGDGVGASASGSQSACTAPAGYSALSSDCNDNDASIKPGATESCNGRDDDCDAQTDEGLTLLTVYRDVDADGFGTASNSKQACGAGSGFVTNADDCDDTKASIHPGAAEQCNGVDDDCDSEADEEVQDLSYYPDADGDGFGADVEPVVDCRPPATGTFVTNALDCDDAEADVKPGAEEVCNGTDDNCDGAADEGLALHTWYRDADGDGYGRQSETLESCLQPTGYVAPSQSGAVDCDDGLADIHPGAAEVCNGWDDDCDGALDTAPASAPLCAAGEVCNSDLGACVDAPEEAPDAGTDGADAGVQPDAGTGGKEEPASGGCSAAGAGTLAWGALLFALLAALRPRRRA